MKTASITLMIAISFFAIVSIWFYKQGKAQCEKQLSEQSYIESQETIKKVKKAYENQKKFSSIDIDSDIEFLQSTFCEDCLLR